MAKKHHRHAARNPIGFFTPMLGKKRVKMRIRPADEKKVTRGLGYKGIIQDLETGKSYKLYGKACSLPGCECDAKIVPVKEKKGSRPGGKHLPWIAKAGYKFLEYLPFRSKAMRAQLKTLIERSPRSPAFRKVLEEASAKHLQAVKTFLEGAAGMSEGQAKKTIQASIRPIVRELKARRELAEKLGLATKKVKKPANRKKSTAKTVPDHLASLVLFPTWDMRFREARAAATVPDLVAVLKTLTDKKGHAIKGKKLVVGMLKRDLDTMMGRKIDIRGSHKAIAAQIKGVKNPAKRTRKANPAVGDLREKLWSIQPSEPMLAGLLNFFFDLPFEGPKFHKVFIGRDGEVRVWIRGQGDNVPLGTLESMVQYLRSIGEQAGLEEQEILEMLEIAEGRSTIASSLREKAISTPTGPKRIGGPTGAIQAPWETREPVLDAKKHKKEEFFAPDFPAVEMFADSRPQVGVIEASKPWVNGGDFEALILLRTEASSTPSLLPEIYGMDPGTEIEDGSPVILYYFKDLWENYYWWVEKQKLYLKPVESSFLAEELRDLKIMHQDVPWQKHIIEYAPIYSKREDLPGWVIYFRFSDGSWGWFRPPPHEILATPEDLGADPYEMGDGLAEDAAEYHGFSWGKVGRRLQYP